MSLLAWIVAGAAIACVVISLVRARPAEARFWAFALGVAALVYPALAVSGGVPAGAARELVGALPWIFVAFTARRLGPLVLAVAWALHGVADMLPVSRPWVPGFYPPLCLGFDAVVATRLVWLSLRR